MIIIFITASDKASHTLIDLIIIVNKFISSYLLQG